MTCFRVLLFLFFMTGGTASFGARVDTLLIPSPAMKVTYRAAVVLPAAYAKNKKTVFPVLYLLHGAFGHFSDWLRKTPDPQLLSRLADQYNLIVVMPEGETFSFYLDSPINAASQFETYLTRDVVGTIDSKYRTVRERKGRVITGLSMGGHGALYLAAKHPELFGAAGSMSGALDLSSLNRPMTAQERAGRQKLFEPILGAEGGLPDLYATNSVLNMLDKLMVNAIPMLIDCGVDDPLLEINREVHRRLLYSHTPHDYTERPGGHDWNYWQNALPYQVLFFSKVLKANGVMMHE